MLRPPLPLGIILAIAAAGAAQVGAARPWLDATKGVEERLEALLPQLTLQQYEDQCYFLDFYGNFLAESPMYAPINPGLIEKVSPCRLSAQTEHLWTTVPMSEILRTYNETGVGASYIAHPTGNATCDSDPVCNLASRLAANRALMRSCGIPLTFVAETLHSPWISQGVVMPMPVTMGATWNISLLTQAGRAIAREATACGVTRGFSPEINVCTDPRFGRTQENFGSDAQHVAACGVAIATGLGGAGSADSPSQYIPDGHVSCEAKHLAAYGSGEMDGAPADISPMTLRDVYLKPWAKFFAAGGRGAMLSHNSVNGIPAHMHKEIMTEIIRGEWNHSRVFFASDFHDIDAIMGFKIAETMEEAAVLAATAGMDQALGGNAYTHLAGAVESGKMSRTFLQRAASAILREKFAGGLFDKKFDGASDGDFGNLAQCRAHAVGGVLDNPEHRAIARRIAQEGTVLLKNGHVPVSTRLASSLAAGSAVGQGCRFTNNSDCYGDGQGEPIQVADAAGCCALCQKTAGCKVAVFIPDNDSKDGRKSDAHGCLLKVACSDPRSTNNRVRCDLPGVDPETLAFGTLPLTAAKWAKIRQVAIVGPNADNAPMIAGSYVKTGTKLTTFLEAAPSFIPKATKIVSAALNYTALIDGGHVGPAAGGDPAPNDHNPKIPGGIDMNVLSPEQNKMIDEAVAAANSSDLAIAVVGDTGSTCGEGTDRISLDLPGVQMQLLGALAAVGKPLIVILVHGRPVTFGPSNKVLLSIDVLLASWIGGEEHGPAMWSIINGEFNPSGRLAQSWPRAVGYVGTHSDSKFGPNGLWQGDYQGMGWRDGELNGPLFAFGFGLSFGEDTFSFTNSGELKVSRQQHSFAVEVEVHSSSTALPGGAVVQLYFSQTTAQAVRPQLMLLGFAKVQRSTVERVLTNITVHTSDLGYWHPLTRQTTVDTGSSYTLSVGSSSIDLSAHMKLTISN